MSKLAAFIVVGLGVALFVATVVSNFASPAPDGLESAVLKTRCADAPVPDECLAATAGDPVYEAAPLPDYEVTWLSGLVGVLACFALGMGLTGLSRRVRGRRSLGSPGVRRS